MSKPFGEQREEARRLKQADSPPLNLSFLETMADMIRCFVVELLDMSQCVYDVDRWVRGGKHWDARLARIDITTYLPT